MFALLSFSRLHYLRPHWSLQFLQSPRPRSRHRRLLIDASHLCPAFRIFSTWLFYFETIPGQKKEYLTPFFKACFSFKLKIT